MGFVFVITVQLAADDQKTQAERVRTHYRNGMKTFIEKSKKYSKKGRNLNKKVLNESVSDEAIIQKAIHFIRTNYIRSLKKSFDQDQSLHLDTIDNKKGYRVSGIPLNILVLRGRIEPFREYEKLAGQIEDVQLIKLTINAIAQKKLEKGDWKAVWYAPNFLEYHLQRVLQRDRRQKFEQQYLVTGETPRIDRFNPPVETKGVNWLFGDLLAMNEYYGDRKQFQQFVFQYPLKTFSRLQAASLSDQFSTDEVIEAYLDYGKKLIDDRERRQTFYRRFAHRLNKRVGSKLLKRAQGDPQGD